MALPLLKNTCVTILLVSLIMVISGNTVMAKEATTLSSSKFGQIMDYMRGFNHGRMLVSKSEKEECQNLELTGNTAKVADATGDTVLVEMKKQRLERVKCNLDCMVRTKSSDWAGYAMSFPYAVWMPIACLVICLLVN